MGFNQRRGSMRVVALGTLAILLIAGVLAGCGGSDDSSTSASSGGGETGSEKSDGGKLGLLLALTGIPFSTYTTQGSEDAADEVGAELTVAGPPTINPTEAIKQFEDMIATGPDGVTVFPIPAELWVPPFSRAAAKGVKLDAIHVPPVEGSEVPLYVGMREKEAAEKLAQVFVDELGPDASGEIILGIGPAGEPVNENRILGYEAVFSSELPDVKVVGPLTTGNEPVENLNNWSQIFQRYPDALAYVGTTDQDCGSLAKLKAKEGGSTLVGAFDPSVENGCLPGIESGDVLAAVEQQPYIRGYIATRVLGEAVSEDVDVPEGWIDTGIQVVTEANAAELTKTLSSIEATRAYYKPTIEEIFADGLDGLPLKPLADVALDPIDEG